jgi:elongation factor G
MKAYQYKDETLGAEFEVVEIPAEFQAEAKKHHDTMIEKVAEAAHEAGDDVLFEKFVHGETPSVAEIKSAIRKATIKMTLFPVICGSAFKNKGVQPMLDCVVDYLPSPLDIPVTMANDPKTGELVERPARDEAPFSALIFKIMTDPFVGQLAFLRVYSGSLNSGDTVLNTTRGQKERIGRLLKMHANKREEIKDVFAGDIAAAVGLRNVTTGDTISDPQHPVVLESINFPAPVIALAVEPKTKSDQEKLGTGLSKLMQEDPTFKVESDPETGQTKISGMGELHLEILVDRLKREFGVEANVGKPQVAYKETIRKSSKAEGKYIKQTGGKGQYGHAKIELEPAPGQGFVFENDISGGSIPKEFIKPIEMGIKEALERGILAGYPVVDVKVRLYDGSYHDVDSSEMAFKISGSMAFQEAAKKATPVLLEPIMKVEVVTPDEYTGAVTGDLSSRRGHLEGQISRGGSQIITALVPLSTMFGYSTDLRSRTQGRATYTMHFEKYMEAPKSVSDEVVARVMGKVTR